MTSRPRLAAAFACAALAATAVMEPAPRAARAQAATLDLAGSALWASAADVEVLGGTAYCAVPEGLLLLDIRNLFTPTVHSFTISPDSAVVGFAFRDTIAYLNMGTAGVAVLDASDPDSARVIAIVPARLEALSAVAGRDSLVYVVERDTLFTYVLGAGGAVTFKDALPVGIQGGSLEWLGDLLFLFGAAGGVALRTDVDGVPTPVDTIADSDTLVAAAGTATHLYVANASPPELVAYSIGGGSALIEEARLPLAGRAFDLDLSGEILAVATDSGYGIYSLIVPESPALDADRFDGNAARAVGLHDRTLAVARQAVGCEFYAIVQPFDLVNVQNLEGGGSLLHADLADDHLYVASQDSGVFRYPTLPGPELGPRTHALFDTVRSVAAADTVVVVGVPSRGLKVYSGPVGGALALRDTLLGPGSFVDLDLRDGIVAAANRLQGVRLWSVANVDDAVSLSNYTGGLPFFDAIRTAFVEDSLLYVLNGSFLVQQSGLYVVDLTDPYFPQTATAVDSIANVADFAIDLANDRMALLHGPPGARDVILYDIVNRASPAPLDTIAVGDGVRVALDATFMVVMMAGGDLHRYIVSGGAGSFAGENPTLGEATWAIAGPVATYILEGTAGIQVFQGSVTADLPLRGTFEYGGNVVAMATQDSTIIVGDNTGVVNSLRLMPGGAIAAIDKIVFTRRIRAISFFSGDSLCGIVSRVSASADSLQIVRVSPTGALTWVAGLEILTTPVEGLVAYERSAGERYLLAGGDLTVVVIDVSNPSTPIVVNEFDARGQSDVANPGNVSDLVLRDRTLFVVFRGGLSPGVVALITSWDLSGSVASPAYLGNTQEPSVEYLSAVIDGLLLYVAEGDNGIGVFSIDDPTQIIKVANPTRVLGAESVTVVGGFLVTANGLSGIAALNLRDDPLDPPPIAEVETPGHALVVSNLPALILVADRFALLVYRTDVITEDIFPPELAIGIVPNPFITAYVDFYVIADEPLDSIPSVGFVLEDLELSLSLTPFPTPTRPEDVYQTSLILDRLGNGVFEVRACDLRDNCVATTREFAFGFLRGAPGGSISLDGGAFKASVEPGAMAGDARILATATRAVDLAAGPWGAGLPDGAASAGYQVSILGGGVAPMRLSFRPPEGSPPTSWQVHRRSASGWVALETRFDGSALEAESPGDGIFWLARGEAADLSGLPREAFLHPNAPNPFNPHTRIRYDVPAPGARVRLAVYSIEGRLVRDLASGFEPAGRRERFWNGRDESGSEVASGIYFLRYEIGDRALTRKMTLLR